MLFVVTGITWGTVCVCVLEVGERNEIGQIFKKGSEQNLRMFLEVRNRSCIRKATLFKCTEIWDIETFIIILKAF